MSNSLRVALWIAGGAVSIGEPEIAKVKSADQDMMLGRFLGQMRGRSAP